MAVDGALLPLPASVYLPSFEAAARSLKVEPITAQFHDDAEIDTAILALGREPGGGLVVSGGVSFAHAAPIISAGARNNVPRSILNLSSPERAACSPTHPTK
jgi:hypothetical protein